MHVPEMDGSGLFRFLKPTLASYVYVDGRGVQRIDNPSIRIGDTDPQIGGIGALDRFEERDLPRLFLSLDLHDVRKDLNIAVPFDQEQVDAVGNICRHHCDRFSARRNEPPFEKR